MAERVAAVIVAGGSGRRLGDQGLPKQYRAVFGAPLLAWAVQPFIRSPEIGRTVLVLPPADVVDPPEWIRRLPVEVVAGGPERGDSVRNGLAALADAADIVLIHDGARPFVTDRLIGRILKGVKSGPVIPGLPSSDTLKEVDPEGRVLATVDRGRFWRVQTPQAFPLGLIRECHERAATEGISLTDDAALLERYGHPVRMVEGEPENIKVTLPIDFTIAEALARVLPESRRPPSAAERPSNQLRVE